MKRGILLTTCLVILTLAGCNSADNLDVTKESGENQFAIILGQLNVDRPSMAIYRSVIQQLSTYFDHKGAEYRSKIVLATDETALVDQMLAGLDRASKAARLDKLKLHYFDAYADACHLDGCLLFRDASRELATDVGAVPGSNTPEYQAFQLALARHLFGWTARQVTTLSYQGNFKNWPAHEILRVGAGDAEDRVRVFLRLAHQSQYDLDGCAILVKRQERQDGQVVTRHVPVLAGVLVGKAIYLFDPATGTAVAGPGGQGVATLEQVRKSPELLKNIKDAPTGAQLAEAEVVVLASLCGMAPRMRVLQGEMEQVNNRVKLIEDLPVRLKRFQQAGIPARPWADPNYPGYPALAIQRYVETNKADPRVDVIVQREKSVPQWALDAEKEILPSGAGATSLLSDFDRQFISLRLEPGGGRDLLVRGNAHQAIFKLGQTEQNLDKALDFFHREVRNNLNPIRETQVKGFVLKSAELRQLQEQWPRTAAGSPERARLEQRINEARAAYDSFWREASIRTAITNMCREWAMPELREHLTYFMGLAKLELALRAEMLYYRLRTNPKAAWPEDLPLPADQFASAAEWFRRYEAFVIPTGKGIWLDAVIQHRKICDEKAQELRTAKLSTQ